MMDIGKIKELTYCVLDLLNNENLPSDEKILKRVEKIFGPFEQKNFQEEQWLRLHSLVSRVCEYKVLELKMRRGVNFRLTADRFCILEECPLQGIRIKNGESDFLNLIVGPMGHMPDGEVKDFIDVILKRLSVIGTVTEAYYFDPYIKEPFGNSFTEKFLTELKLYLPPLVAVTTHTITTNNSNFPIEKIPGDKIHDRFVIISDDKSWKGVSVGGSLNGFPHADNGPVHTKKHFIISKLEDEDASLLAEVLKKSLKL